MIPFRLLLMLADEFIEAATAQVVISGPYRFVATSTFGAGAKRGDAFSAGAKTQHAFSAGAQRSGAKET